MKKAFRTHIILVTEGRLLALLLPTGIMVWLYQAVKWYINTLHFVFLISILFASGMLFLCFYLAKTYWQLFWGKLIITDNCLKWRCIGCKTQTIPLENVKQLYVCSFAQGNIVRNIYQTGFRYVVIVSKTGVQKKHGGRIKSGNGVISFPYSLRLRKSLREVFPDRKNALPK